MAASWVASFLAHSNALQATLSNYPVLLLDLNGTFMFGQDRFGPDEDYYSTYAASGGRRLSPAEVNALVTACCDYLTRRGRDPQAYDAFPQCLDALRSLPESRGLALSELLVIEQVIATHELGRVPEEYASALRHAAQRHRLGIVSNIWSSKQGWLAELKRAGILEIFEVMIFSSDGTSIKPSSRLFNQAVDALRVSRDQVLFVGDSLSRDIAGAHNAGLSSGWINPGGQVCPPDGPQPAWVVKDLLGLILPNGRDVSRHD